MSKPPALKTTSAARQRSVPSASASLSRRFIAAAGLADDPLQAARQMSLRYVSDQSPGLRRVRSGRGFRYVDANGKTVRDPATLARIHSLAIPPAWTDVWICTLSEGHLQSTGRDARGRKQYRYHPRWREVRDEAKYARLTQFGAVLPRIRRRVARDLALPGMPRNKVLALLVQLLETTLIRIGNEEYARANGSFGLTTMRDQHAQRLGGHGSLPVSRQERKAPRSGLARSAAGAPGAPLSGIAWTRALSIHRRNGRRASRRFSGGERLPPRNHGPAIYRQGLSHLGRHLAGSPDASAARGASTLIGEAGGS